MGERVPQAEIETLTRLARGFRERGLHDEAAELLAVALRIDRHDPELRAELARVEEQRRVHGRPKRHPRSVRESLREELRRNAIDASHFLGLAYLYSDQGQDSQALECLEVGKAKDLAGPALHKLYGKLLFRRGDYERAVDELVRALRLNPFDRESAELLGRAEFERRRIEPALTATVHAFLLLQDGDEEGSERLRRRIRTLKHLLGHGTSELTAVFHERQEALQTAYERLAWRRERFPEEEGLVRGARELTTPVRRRIGGRIALAGRLRRLDLFSHLTDDHVFRLTQVADEEAYDPGAVIFPHDSPGRDLFVIDRGGVSIQRNTSYGTFTLGVLGPGELFGEASFATGHPRSGDALAAEPTRLFRFEGDLLSRLVDDRHELGVQLYWSLWRGLARKLRATNAQLQSFFDPGTVPENFLRLRRVPARTPGAPSLAVSDKVRLFREQGLSRRELTTLATFSEERRFPEGAYLFHEGDRGGELYVVAEGRVMISKLIAGGEEALAILGRGDFFGEMALIDGEPRSADARAHGGPLTVLVLDRDSVKEVLSMDSAAALQFLQLLCRLIANRLREIDEKVIGWRILAGEQTETVSA
jgi:CRP-like cAMP-binding protein/tetratricopeptide (TPR) repeat protein